MKYINNDYNGNYGFNNNSNNNNNNNDNSNNNNNNNNYNNNNNNNNDKSVKKNNSNVKNCNSTEIVQNTDYFAGSENICVPIGIVSLPSSTSFPTATEHNSLLRFLGGGDFNSVIIDYSSLLRGNKKKTVKSIVVIAPIRFLVFTAMHISLTSILPLILTHTQKLIIKNKLSVVNAKNKKYYETETEISVDNGKIENTEIPITEITQPPMCPFLARDLCSDLLNAVRHCIHWYVLRAI